MAKLQTITFASLEDRDNLFRIETDPQGKASVLKYTIGQDGIKVNDGSPISPSEAKYVKIVDTTTQYDISQPIKLYGYETANDDIFDMQFQSVELPEDYWIDEELANKKCAYINAQPEIDAFIETYKNLAIVLPEHEDMPKLEIKSFTLSRDNLGESMETFTNYVIGLINREITFATEVDGKYVSDQTIDQAFAKIREYV
jgi:hypothetical protein